MTDAWRGQVVVAPDSFRGSLTAVRAAGVIADGVLSVHPHAEVRRVPVADGGEGTLDCAVAAGFEPRSIVVTGPLGDQVHGRIAVRRRSAVVELAELCGWARMPAGRTDALHADTRGLGDGVRAMLDLGCDDIVIAVGGSVSTDAGLGMLRALGAVTRDAHGDDVTTPGGGALHRIASIDASGLDPRLGGARFRLATDVTNPLLGAGGAAAVFAPQKGASPADVRVLEDGLSRVADVIEQATRVRVRDVPGVGAAGGVGASALAYLGAEIVSGADTVLDLVGFAAAVADADWVVTGEGRWDAQTVAGKAPARVAAVAHAAGVRVAVVAGVVEASRAELRSAGVSAWRALIDYEPDLARCIAQPEPLLAAAGADLARRFSG